MSRAEPAGSAVQDGEVQSGRRVLSDSVAEWIAERVLDGTYPTGERLPPERELAEQLGVNRSSVREALKKLEQLRLVEIQQGSGIRACATEQANLELVTRLLLRDGRPDAARMLELMELRDVLFLGLLRLGLERGTQEEIDQTVALLERLTDPALPEADVVADLLRVHDAAARMAHNQIALMLWNSLRRFLTQPPMAAARKTASATRLEFAPQVRRLAHAIAARDQETVARTARELLRRVERQLCASLEAQPARPAPNSG